MKREGQKISSGIDMISEQNLSVKRKTIFIHFIFREILIYVTTISGIIISLVLWLQVRKNLPHNLHK